MSHNRKVIFIHNFSSWKNVAEYIHRMLHEYYNIKTIGDVIANLNEIRRLFKGAKKNSFYDITFTGLGVFLKNLDEKELRQFINVSIRNVLCYCLMVEQLEGVLEEEIAIRDGMARVSLLSAKTLLACSVLCILPPLKRGSEVGELDKLLTVDLRELFVGVVHGSKNHVTLLKSILNFFLEDPTHSMDRERQQYISVSTSRSDSSPLFTASPTLSWPIILSAKSTITDTLLPNDLNMSPIYFQRIPTASLFSSSDLSSELPIYSNVPVLIPLLPLLVFDILDNIDVIGVTWENLHYSIQKVELLNSWSRESQFATDCILRNIERSLLAIQISQRRYSNFDNSFTQSVIEDAIDKLNAKSPPLPNSYVDNLPPARLSLTSNALSYDARGSRDGSICSHTAVRSARHSYSNSSSSRSGSLQLSSSSSRRSSSNVSSSLNKEADVCNAPGDKVDYGLHSFQPIIVEESGNHIDEEELPFVPIQVMVELACTLECSKEVLQDIIQDKPSKCTTRRRNSSPLLKLSFPDENEENQLVFERKELYNRCCEEDANNDHLIRLNNRGRRQSLPCHLQWLYQRSLKNRAKPHASRSSSLINNKEISLTNIFDVSSDELLDRRIFVESGNILTKLLAFADRLLNEVFLNGSKNEEQQTLRQEVLQKRNLFQKLFMDVPIGEFVINEQPAKADDDHSLHSKDLASFDQVLNSASFFDNEALQFFSKYSTMSSTSSVWTPHEGFRVGDNSTAAGPIINEHDKSRSKESTIVDYVNQLTSAIISDVMDHDFGPTPISVDRQLCDPRLHNLSDRISVEIIATSLSQLCNRTEQPSGHASSIYCRSFPVEYDRQLAALVQLLAASVSQHRSGQTHIVVFGQVTVEMEEIFLLLSREKKKFSPQRIVQAIATVAKETGSISMSELISYLTHD